MRESIAYFDNFCPACKGRIDDARLEEGRFCPLCEERGYTKGIEDILTARRLLEKFKRFFKKAVGEEPWSLQLTWAKRVFLKRSFAIQAPTGIGKTTFGMVMAAFLEGKSYIVVPTKLLVEQVRDGLNRFTPKKVIAYTGKKAEKKCIEEGDFDILVTTQAFLQRNIDIIPKDFSFIFVDDVDSVLKNPKNIDNIFILMGLSPEDVEYALKAKVEDLEKVRGKIKGVLVVSSATLKPKTRRVALFRTLLGFDIQRSVSTIREVYDFSLKVSGWEQAKEKALDIINLVGSGVFLFVPPDIGKAGVEEMLSFLEGRGIGAVSYEDFGKRIEDFKSGKVKVAVGIAHSNNALVRGVDLPYHVKCAVFLGVPKFYMPLKIELDPRRLFILLRILNSVLDDEKLSEHLLYVSRYSTMSPEQLDKYPIIKKRIEEICKYLNNFINRDDIISFLRESPEVTVEEKEGELFLVVADATSYIQASGRTSRLIPGGITKGLSVVLFWEEKAMTSLERRTRYLLPTETQFKRIEDLEEIIEVLPEVEESRKKKASERKQLFKSALVVVESPNKARTISSFFGRPQRRWINNFISYEIVVGNIYLIVAASVGHVTDLTVRDGFFGVLEESGLFKPVYTSIKKCPCGEQCTDVVCHKCGNKVLQDKIDLIENLRRLSFEVDEVYIATDPDSEGEKIAWDLYLSVKPFNPEVKRVEFHEVTATAFRRALEEKRDVDMDRVKAQLVRRIADRWVGFTFSQRLQHKFRNRALSAGRVQTPVLGWVIDRTDEAKEKKALIILKVAGVEVPLEVEDLSEAERIFKTIERARVMVGEPYEDTISPQPPYTTSELLKDASSRLRLSAEDTMRLAQQLFELGFITYHRTDSTRVSNFGINVAKRFIEENYPGFFKPRTWGEGGAHECIRPTKALTPFQLRAMQHSGETELDKRAVSLYTLIFNRFMASQMKEARVKKVDVNVMHEGIEKEESFVVEVIDPGFSVLGSIKVYQVDPERAFVEEKSMRLVPKAYPFTEGSLVDEMKKRGLGRPSTYAKIVQTIINRGYVTKRRQFLYATPLGRRVFSYLRQFEPYTSEEFTRILEELMDRVEERKEDYQAILRRIYHVREYLP